MRRPPRRKRSTKRSTRWKPASKVKSSVLHGELRSVTPGMRNLSNASARKPCCAADLCIAPSPEKPSRTSRSRATLAMLERRTSLMHNPKTNTRQAKPCCDRRVGIRQRMEHRKRSRAQMVLFVPVSLSALRLLRLSSALSSWTSGALHFFPVLPVCSSILV